MADLKDELERERREKEWAESWRPDEPGPWPTSETKTEC